MATPGDDKHAETKEWIVRWCRRFKPEHVDWERASDQTGFYNCMGFAMGPTRETGELEWWQKPEVSDGVSLTPQYYWPPGVKPGDDFQSFRLAAEAYGFKECASPDPEPGFEKVVIYYAPGGDYDFWHAAVPVTDTVWVSKIAEHSDIAHPPDAFDDVAPWHFRGTGRFYMKRPAQGRAVPPVETDPPRE